MIDPSQSPRDKVLWELANHGKMKKSDLRRRTKLNLSELEPILEELEKEGRIRIDANMISSK
jgi:DNA-binding MarR family transcriptional regulator